VLFGADSSDRTNYYLSDKQNKRLQKNGYILDKEVNIPFYKTDIRLENVEDMQEVKNVMEDKNLVVFTHEWKIDNEIKEKIKTICELAINNNYVFTLFNK